LSMPPAFNLSQDQTLQFNLKKNTKSNPTQNYLSAHTNCMIFLLLKNCWPEALLSPTLAPVRVNYTHFFTPVNT
ncbi:hypothetical protein AB894_00370, partial [Piscirickettsia salmonis]